MKKVKREVQKSVYSIMNDVGQQKVIVAISMSDAFKQCEPDMGKPLYGKALDMTVEDYYKQEAAHKTTTIMAVIMALLIAISAIFSLIMITK